MKEGKTGKWLAMYPLTWVMVASTGDAPLTIDAAFAAALVAGFILMFFWGALSLLSGVD
jgi:hypothetical protein